MLNVHLSDARQLREHILVNLWDRQLSFYETFKVCGHDDRANTDIIISLGAVPTSGTARVSP